MNEFRNEQTPAIPTTDSRMEHWQNKAYNIAVKCKEERNAKCYESGGCSGVQSQNEVVSIKDVLTSSTLSSVPAAVFCIACINV